MRDLKLNQISKVVGSVFQDPRSQFFTMDTTSELAFFSENMGIARNEIIKRLHQTVTTLHIENLLDRNIFHLSSGEKQKIAIGSIYAAGPSIYVLDEPSANLDYQATEDEAELRAKAAKILSDLNLSCFKDRHPAALSGGQKQKVVIAVPLVKGSSIIILDEPTSGLDAENMRQVASLIQDVAAEGKTVFVITHDYEFILHTCTRIVHLCKEKIKADFSLHNDSLAQLKGIFIR